MLLCCRLYTYQVYMSIVFLRILIVSLCLFPSERQFSLETYQATCFLNLCRSFFVSFIAYFSPSSWKDLLTCQFPISTQVFLLPFLLLSPAIPRKRPTNPPILSPCVGLFPPSSSFIPSHPSRKTYYPANPIHLRRSFSANIIFYPSHSSQ